ncbi:DGQHR domain-containing protein [Altererythrobacter sp. KTW20L]|uniref:DGQHR domain-containing protein n=1 Tax=Altererythrobacter sp. KTW20L TaxID=2942210 RepID=UPI0020BFF8FE|nr:DGQHR domain-containing protein [Altererythrobacter sp. KTW20L]MCL6250085.1 DGQHR domain-containing protein [Altererythrobacter sp. KTW20L]
MKSNKSTKPLLMLPALKGKIGKWFYYSTLMKFSEVKTYISLTTDFYENKNLSDMIQRAIDTKRSEKIADYIQQVQERFFPSMVIAVYEGAPKFHEFDVSPKGNGAMPSVDISKSQAFGYLELSGDEILFPLDGQHRLSGIKKVLQRIKDDPKSEIPDDELSVIMIGHEPTNAGRQRSRRLFTTLNKRAVTVKISEIIALDEDDVIAIACRHVVEDLKGWSQDKFVSLKSNAALTVADAQSFTSIITLYECFRVIFMALVENQPNESNAEKKDRLRFNRPMDAWLDVYLATADAFLSQIAKRFPEVGQALEAGDVTTIINQHRKGDGGHVLFRPRGLSMFAELVAASISWDGAITIEGKQADPKKIKRLAIKRVREGVDYFSDIETDITKRPYRDLFFEPVSQQLRPGKMPLVRDLLLYNGELVSERKIKAMEKRLESQMGEHIALKDFLAG